MRVIISAGGTGGHIYPALAIVNCIKEKEPDSEFLYIGTHNRMEKDIVPKTGIPFVGIEMYGFNRKNLLKNFKTIKCLYKSKKQLKSIIKEFNPDIVIGVGGYITYPVITTAHKLGYITFIHEQNSVAGKANLMMADCVDLIGVSLKSSMKEFPTNKVIFTGNPCGENALKVKRIDKTTLGFTKGKKLVVIVMGSLGAENVHNFMKDNINKFDGKNYELLYITGKNNFEDIKSIKHPSNVKLLPYLDNLAGLFKDTDILITRAGASTLSEIIALKLPSILIPSPFVPNNHQYKNAMDLVNNKAALLVEEKDLTFDNIDANINKLLSDKVYYLDMKNNLESMQVNDSATIIYNNIKKLIDRK